MINFIIHNFKKYPWFKRFNARVTYELLARRIPAHEWQFMNYGYAPDVAEPAFQAPPGILQRYPLQMYHYLAIKKEIRGKDVLEVGSGRGGGARYLAEHLGPASYVGVDLAQAAVRLACGLHCLPNLKFRQGSAEALPLHDNSVDTVINVESCHAYGSVDRFLGEVTRVLKPGGHLLLTDFRSINMEQFFHQLDKSGLAALERENISANVLKAIEAEDAEKRERIEKLVPERWRSLLCDFAGVVGSRFYNTLKDGTRQYYRFVLQKPF